MITFIHNPPFLLWNDEKEKKRISSEMIVSNNHQFNENVFNEIKRVELNKHITFLYTLSNDHKRYLLNTYPEYKNKIVSIYHPINIETTEDKKFNIELFLINKKIYNIGWWLRNFKSFINFSPPSDFKKIIIVKDDFERPFYKTIVPNNDISSVEIISQMNDEEYSNLFKNSCVFADIIDCIANNTVLEWYKIQYTHYFTQVQVC